MAMSTGMEAAVVTNPLIMLAQKWHKMLSWKYPGGEAKGGGAAVAAAPTPGNADCPGRASAQELCVGDELLSPSRQVGRDESPSIAWGSQPGHTEPTPLKG